MKRISIVVSAFIPFVYAESTSLLYERIAQENLKSLVHIEENKSVPHGSKRFHEVLQETLEEQLNPKPEVKRRLAFALLKQYEKEYGIIEENVLDDRSWQDLEIVCGPKSHSAMYIASRVDRTSTELGRLTLYHKILQPTADYDKLIQRQALVKELIANTELFSKLDALLSQLYLPENALFSFWDTKDIFWKTLGRDEITLPFQDKSPSLKLLAHWLDTHALINELYDKSYLITLGIRGITMGISTITLPLYALSLMMQQQSPRLKEFNEWLGVGGALSVYSISGALYYGINKLFPTKFAETGANLTAGVAGQAAIASVFRNIRNTVIFNKCLQKKLIHVATYFRTLKEIASLLESNSFISQLIDIQELYFTSCCQEIRDLLTLLETTTFKGEPSFFSYTGRIIAAYKMLYLCKEQLLKPLAVLGEVDMYVSIARLYKEFENERVHFCFPEYLSNTSGPSIICNNFWNPLISLDRVIPNSLELGYGIRNCVITGPNAGGKSTILRALILNIILAQSMGIAPSEKLTFTPFSHITTYLNITDDITIGNSLFKAAVLRAREVLTRVEELQPQEYALTAVDEVFNGTSYQEGQAAAYTLLKMLGYQQHSICVTATHFPLITHLERETGLFANYKVSVSLKEGQKIKYPYKLKRGIADQVITFRILQEEGFSDAFLKEAEKALERAKCVVKEADNER